MQTLKILQLSIMNINVSSIFKGSFVLIHFLFWMMVWAFYIYFFSYNAKNTDYIIWFSSFLLPVTMGTTYFMIYYLLPQFLLQKKYGYFLLYLLYTLVISTYLILLSIFGCIIFLANFSIQNLPPMSKNYVFILILVYLVVGFVCGMYLLKRNFEVAAQNQSLATKILETQLQLKQNELAYLKKQIHPHFLFNTLNTIYGFALKQAKETPDLILKLSQLLNYILYQVNKDKVKLSDEIDHLKAYLDLEQIRFQETLSIDFKMNTLEKDLEIPPMLFIPFVENAFKHGGQINNLLEVKVKFYIQPNIIDFEIQNTILDTISRESNHGLGLDNIKKRLDLLFDQHYQLDISTVHNWFIVRLKIDLK